MVQASGIGGPAPLILTLSLDETSQAHFDEMRLRHFPPARNHLRAHLTLFHALPGDEIETVMRTLAEIAAGQREMPLQIGGVRFLGYGSAYEIVAPGLLRLRGDLATHFADRLTPQDRQGFRPHITIQNKAPADAAKRLYAQLSDAFEPFEATGVGLSLWHYRGGPWEAAGDFPFILDR